MATAADILRNPMKEKLARGEVVASMTVRLSRGIEIARIAKTAGFDMLYIDMEHSPLTQTDACPGRAAARSDAAQTRDPGFFLYVESNRGPGSAAHRSAALRAAPRPGHVRRVM